jgi:hypothetical protein
MKHNLKSWSFIPLAVIVLAAGLLLATSTFAAVYKISDNSVIALWHMNGDASDSACSVNGTSTDVDFSSGNGILHQGAGFNGSTSVINFGNNFDMTGNESRSWAFWFKPSKLGINYIFAKGDDVHETHTAHGYWLTQVDDRIYWTMNAGDGYGTNEIQMQTGSVVPTSTWYFVVVTYDGSKSASGVHIYVDNVDQAMQVDQNSLTDSTANSADFTIGAASDGTRPNQMALDELVTFNKVISTSTIDTLYHHGHGREVSAGCGI